MGAAFDNLVKGLHNQNDDDADDDIIIFSVMSHADSELGLTDTEPKTVQVTGRLRVQGRKGCERVLNHPLVVKGLDRQKGANGFEHTESH